MIPDNFKLEGVRCKKADDLAQVTEDALSQNIDIKLPSDAGTAASYLCSVMSRMIRLPPFIFAPKDGVSCLKIMSELTSKESIMQVTDKNLFIIPTEDARM